MSAPEPECVVCGRVAIGLNGWDGGFPSYRMFRALWDPPHMWYSSIHFSCLRDWPHRAEMLTELVALATDSVLEYDVEVNGETHHVARTGLGYTQRLLETDDLLVLQHSFSSDWMTIDFSGAWQFFGLQDLLALIRGEAAFESGGWGRYGLRLSPRPPEPEVASWTLSDLLSHFAINDRYPGLTDSRAILKVIQYNSGNGHLEYEVDYPLSIHPAALAYFRDRYERDGEAAFAALGIPPED